MEIKFDEAISLMTLNEILKPSLNLHQIDNFITTRSDDFYELTVMTGEKLIIFFLKIIFLNIYVVFYGKNFNSERDLKMIEMKK